MISTVFSDNIVKATDLRTNQKEWLERAYHSPVTVNYGQRQLALMNREQVGKLYIANHYLELVTRACDEFMKESGTSTFPWVEYLSGNERQGFHRALMTRALKCVATGDWKQVESLIEDWKAAAIAKSSPSLVEALTAEEDPLNYVEVEG